MKKGVFKRLVATMALMCMVVMMCIPASAVTYVRSLTVRVTNNGDYVYPTISVGSSDDENRYMLKEDIKWDKDASKLEAGQTITATFVIVPAEGYEIRLSDGRASINVRGSGATLSSYSRNGSEYTIKVKWIVNGMLASPESAYWDYDKPWIARWERVTNADSYQVQLYRNNTRIASYETTSRSYNFANELASSKYAEKDGIYFRVRAMHEGTGIDDSEWIESDEFWDWNELWYYCKEHNITWKGSNNYSDSSWNNNSNNNYNPNGPTPSSAPSGKNGWSGNPGYWQYYQNGNLVKNNWVSDNGNWYWMDGTGRMVTGWFHHSDGRWYYMTPAVGGPEGSCVRGWIFINSKWYYFYPGYGVNNGYSYKESEMAANTWIDNFYVGSDGAWTGQTR